MDLKKDQSFGSWYLNYGPIKATGVLGTHRTCCQSQSDIEVFSVTMTFKDLGRMNLSYSTELTDE